MISPTQVEEWIKEVEERPGSAPLIIQYISSRLRDLTNRNEELLAENIALRSGRKVEDFENKIANLEYQLDLIKRQLDGVDPSSLATNGTQEFMSLLIYQTNGKILRTSIDRSLEAKGETIARLPQDDSEDSRPPRMLITSIYEELLVVFDSGRTETIPVTQVPLCETSSLSWGQSYIAEPRGGEELVVIVPIGKMSLFDYCVQISRRGCAKKMMKSSFESHVSKSFIGAGVKAKADKTCDLVFCKKGDPVILATYEGYLLTIDSDQLPFTIEEILKLSITDHISSCANVEKKPEILILTENGKIIHRETTWLEKANSFKSKGQSAFSQSRREAGARIISAVPVSKDEWCAALNLQGEIQVAQVTDLLNAGAFPGDSEAVKIIDFAVFPAPEAQKGS
jgi:DNA gyrase/topoisomerase IV subunit A